MISLLQVREVKLVKYKIDEYVTISIYMFKTNVEDNNVLVSFIRKLYLIDDLKVKMLIDNDILKSEEIFINIA